MAGVFVADCPFQWGRLLDTPIRVQVLLGVFKCEPWLCFWYSIKIILLLTPEVQPFRACFLSISLWLHNTNTGANYSFGFKGGSAVCMWCDLASCLWFVTPHYIMWMTKWWFHTTTKGWIVRNALALPLYVCFYGSCGLSNKAWSPFSFLLWSSLLQTGGSPCTKVTFTAQMSWIKTNLCAVCITFINVWRGWLQVTYKYLLF